MDFEPHLSSVYRFALSLTGDVHVAEEITQETMLRAWKKRRSLRDAGAMRTWLLRIVVRVHTDAFRQTSRRKRRESLAAHAPLPSPPPSVHATELHETHELIRSAMAELPPGQRDVLHLAACEGLEPAQIAIILDRTPGNVRSTLSLARKRIAAALTSSMQSVERP